MSEILGVLFGLMLGLLGMSQISSSLREQQHLQSNIATAMQQQDWVQGVSDYVTTNMASLQATATATSPVVINLAKLQTAGVTLPTGFNGTNPYNQTWVAEVLEPTPGHLQVLVYSMGGTRISDKDLGSIARNAAGVGGMLPSNDSGAYPGGAANAYGAFGAWKIATTNYTNIAGGRPASLLNFSNGLLSSNYLYRNAVPGQPQLNQMNTDLGMGNNDIAAANQISTQSLKVLANGSRTSPSVTLANGSVVAFNQVSEGGVLSLVGANGQAIYVESLNGKFRLINNPWNAELFSVDQSGNVVARGGLTVGGSAGVGGSLTVTGNAGVGGSLTVNGGTAVGGSMTVAGNTQINGAMTAGGKVTSGGDVVATGAVVVNGKAAVGAGCATKGAMAQSSSGTGEVIVCKSGRWTAMGGGFTKTTLVQAQGSGQASVQCPAGWTVTGGGYQWNFSGGSKGYGIVTNVQNGNGWYAGYDGIYSGALVHVYAVCAQ